MTLRIGTAGWSLPREWQSEFSTSGSHLERYASRFSAVEINSSFYRQHKRDTYARWAAGVPEEFRFAVKVPRAITHDQLLVSCDVLLEVFLEEATALGRRLGPLLVQLPPSLEFDADRAGEFFHDVRVLFSGDVVCEPRHATWFAHEADCLLAHHRVTRAIADPMCVAAAGLAGGWLGLRYQRLHGSPRMYYSAYSAEYIAVTARELTTHERAESDAWCIFDNTTLGAATGDALALSRLVTTRN